AQRKRDPNLWRDEKRLHKQHRSEKRENAENEQSQTQSRPAFAGRVGKHKRGQRVWRDVLHEPPIFAHYVRNESCENLSSVAALYEAAHSTDGHRPPLQFLRQLLRVLAQKLRR